MWRSLSGPTRLCKSRLFHAGIAPRGRPQRGAAAAMIKTLASQGASGSGVPCLNGSRSESSAGASSPRALRCGPLGVGGTGTGELADTDSDARLKRKLHSLGPVATTSSTPTEHSIPTDKLAPLDSLPAGVIPIVLLACGSFNPPHYMHLRLFELAKESLERTGKYKVIGGYMSPVSDHYKKPGLESAQHRLKMCRLAARESDYVMVDGWEADQESWTRTKQVVESVQHRVCECTGNDDVDVLILCGSDLVETFRTPGLWKEKDVRSLVEDHGIACISRVGYDAQEVLKQLPFLTSGEKKVHVVEDPVFNDLSSSRLREVIEMDKPITYLTPNSVVYYIYKNGLYRAS